MEIYVFCGSSQAHTYKKVHEKLKSTTISSQLFYLVNLNEVFNVGISGKLFNYTKSL